MNKHTLARWAITTYLTTHQLPLINTQKLPPRLSQKGACFVSVYVNGRLRGCIGTAQAFEPLCQNIVRNAVVAVSSDWRFPPLALADLAHLKIEVSVLTPLKLCRPKSLSNLLSYLEKNRPGLVLISAGRQALFLPQVWQQLPQPQDFLTHLCLKAGLSPNTWQDKTTRFSIFNLQP